jgi:ribosomal protein L40E
VPVPEAASAPTPTAQPCVSCGLSLSANARFCRRCGTRQG